MKRFAVIVPVFVGTLVYSILGITVGPRGMLPMAGLSGEKARIGRNLEILYEINADLDARYRSLNSDPDTISVYAHELGYVASGERLIKLAGFAGGIDRALVSGTAETVHRPSYLPEWLCKTLGIFATLLAAVPFCRLKRKPHHGHQKE